jgi:hypothetical protein
MKRCIIPALVLLAVCAALALASCESKDALEGRVAAQFQQQLNTDPKMSGFDMKVKSVSLVKTGPRAYSGFVTVVLDGKTHNIGINLISDGRDILLETEPFAFSFLAEKAMETLFGF